MLEISVPKASGRLAAIDELKGLAIVGVVLYHAGGALVWGNYLHGDIGVDIFLLLSGASLALSSHQGAPLAFLARRVLRVFPTYWIALAAFVVFNTWILGQSYGIGDIALHAAGLHGLAGDRWAFTINPSFWFITPLFFYYACFAWMRTLLSRTDVFIAVSGALAAVVSLGLFFSNQGSLMGHWGFRAVAFFAGALAGHALREGRLKVPLTPWLAVGLLLAFYVPYMFGIAFHTTLAGGAVMLGYLALRTRFEMGGEKGVPGVLALLGRHSLEIFLLHQPLMREYVFWVLGRYFGGGPYSDVLVIATMTLALVPTLFLAFELRRVTERFGRRAG